MPAAPTPPTDTAAPPVMHATIPVTGGAGANGTPARADGREAGAGPVKSGKAATWGKRLGVIAFMFFLIKGLAWLVVPAALAVFATR